jgi:hypothetical protein
MWLLDLILSRSSDRLDGEELQFRPYPASIAQPSQPGPRAQGHRRRAVDEPVGPRRGRAERWHRYARQEIPRLFGFEFNPGLWNAGFVALPGHLFLLVTLDKSGHAEGFQYQDRFVAPDVFQWQSQNRTRRESRHGQLIRDHEEKGVRVHLFVRGEKRGGGGGSAPFVYCGEVRFVEWEGEAPITVRWRLGEGCRRGWGGSGGSEASRSAQLWRPRARPPRRAAFD